MNSFQESRFASGQVWAQVASLARGAAPSILGYALIIAAVRQVSSGGLLTPRIVASAPAADTVLSLGVFLAGFLMASGLGRSPCPPAWIAVETAAVSGVAVPVSAAVDGLLQGLVSGAVLGGVGLFRLSVRIVRDRTGRVRKVLFLGTAEESEFLERETRGLPGLALQGRLCVSPNGNKKRSSSAGAKPRAGSGVLSCSLVQAMERLQPTHVVYGCRHKSLGATDLRQLLAYRLSGVSVQDLLSFYQSVWRRTPLHLLDDGWLLAAPGFDALSQPFIRRLKRVTDFLFAIAGLVLSAPLMALIAAAIKLDSPGPVLYRQRRVGWRGKLFYVWKFRSMTYDAAEQTARWAGNGDPRITRVGRWIRRARLDELPQFWNVLKGEMSFIGPRPEQAPIAHQLSELSSYYSARHSVRPGITGWAQVTKGYCATQQDSLAKLEYDLYYVQHRSLRLDLEILTRTISVVLTGRGSR